MSLRHNPKSSAPAVYIPYWLIQVVHEKISFGAKLLYGRLAQWSSVNGEVYRSSIQLSKELGMGVRTIEKFIKELKDIGLIGTYHPQAGGLNHFIFYDHPWMHEKLSEDLDPPHNRAVPPAQPCGTLPHNRADISSKEVKEVKTKSHCANSSNRTTSHESIFETFWKAYPEKKAKKKCFEIWKRKKLSFIADHIMEKLETQKERDKQWKEGYIPNPSTYLNQERWDDEISIDHSEKQSVQKELEKKKREADKEKFIAQQNEYQKNKDVIANQNGEIFRGIASRVKEETKNGLSDAAKEELRKMKAGMGILV